MAVSSCPDGQALQGRGLLRGGYPRRTPVLQPVTLSSLQGLRCRRESCRGWRIWSIRNEKGQGLLVPSAPPPSVAARELSGPAQPHRSKPHIRSVSGPTPFGVASVGCVRPCESSPPVPSRGELAAVKGPATTGYPPRDEVQPDLNCGRGPFLVAAWCIYVGDPAN